MPIRQKLLSLFALCLLLEMIVATVIYYADHRQPTVGFVAGVLSRKLQDRQREDLIASMRDDVDLDHLKEHFFTDARYADKRREAEALYEEAFTQLDSDVARDGALLVMLYIPSHPNSHPHDRDYYRDLCTRHKVPFIDATDALSVESRDIVYQEPLDGHLSRYGNTLLARYLAKALEPRLGHRSPPVAGARPARLGDLPLPQNGVDNTQGQLPYLAIHNEQGLRSTHPLPERTGRDACRILCLGDSFTYGAYVNNRDAFPQVLDRLLGDNVEAVNAGVAGYTVTDQAEMYRERSRFVDADIVVLQVLDNDLYDLVTPYNRIYLSREARVTGQ